MEERVMQQRCSRDVDYDCDVWFFMEGFQEGFREKIEYRINERGLQYLLVLLVRASIFGRLRGIIKIWLFNF